MLHPVISKSKFICYLNIDNGSIRYKASSNFELRDQTNLINRWNGEQLFNNFSFSDSTLYVHFAIE